LASYVSLIIAQGAAQSNFNGRGSL